ncbi:DUF4123 domain-containing protein [Pseudomonas sp. CCI1.2]|uniref:DUF4123 domain-containing protein n=1 Tax=unclassified Pseudomonas TaxID=196821 RepID=UPI002AC960F8|nr:MULTISPECIES: DUF4123 domain-containing protein [unclassified Pseudomonas]MEB0094440.1 DUF4123 domain-containing protein [Pseudomonas sp. CCI4.2]MEB0122178.1 DUF4123 domain-containing protein [Pseudomonas sp. CCI1.2]WPX55191.1 DUF4123 domain-containing protein [Pseudomonas sp. CCI4.2]
MNLSSRDWLNSLQEQAKASDLEHLDILIDATGLDYPLLKQLAELEPRPLQALLFDGTPEHDLAEQGPVLIRLLWAQPEQVNWLGGLLKQLHGQSRVLALLSRWPFEPLTEHLRYCTQAQWNNGAISGVLRYYDTRLFKHISGLFVGDDNRDLHAPVITWHWIDRDQRAQIIGGAQLKLYEYTKPTSPLMLDDRQMQSIYARGQAEQWEANHGPIQQSYPMGKEQLIAQVHIGQLAANSQRLEGEERRAFMVEWLAEHLPATVSSTSGLA